MLNEVRTHLDGVIEGRRDELQRLEAARTALGGEPTAEQPKRRGRPPGKRSAAAKPKRQRRKRRGGTRADHALELIAKTPGISASIIADALKIKPNYLYRVLGDLEKEGRVRKEGRRYYPISDGESGAAATDIP